MLFSHLFLWSTEEEVGKKYLQFDKHKIYKNTPAHVSCVYSLSLGWLTDSRICQGINDQLSWMLKNHQAMLRRRKKNTTEEQKKTKNNPNKQNKKQEKKRNGLHVLWYEWHTITVSRLLGENENTAETTVDSPSTVSWYFEPSQSKHKGLYQG